MPDLTVRPLTADRWADLETLFAARGCSVARHCWCMHYRRTGRAEMDEHAAPVNAGEYILSMNPEMLQSRKEMIQQILKELRNQVPGVPLF